MLLTISISTLFKEKKKASQTSDVKCLVESHCAVPSEASYRDPVLPVKSSPATTASVGILPLTSVKTRSGSVSGSATIQ